MTLEPLTHPNRKQGALETLGAFLVLPNRATAIPIGGIGRFYNVTHGNATLKT